MIYIIYVSNCEVFLFLSFLNLFLLFLCFWVFHLYAYVWFKWVPVVCRGQKKAPDRLKLKLKKQLWAATWVLGIQLGSAVRTQAPLTAEPFLQPCPFFLNIILLYSLTISHNTFLSYSSLPFSCSFPTPPRTFLYPNKAPFTFEYIWKETNKKPSRFY